MLRMRYPLITLALMCSAYASANLIVNGSFEDPPISTNFITVPAGNTTITGWTVLGSSVDLCNQNFLSGFPARDADQFVDLAGSPGPGRVEQSFATSIGTTYNVFFSGSSNGASSPLEVYLNGSLLYNITPPPQGTWTDYGFQFQAPSTTSSIGFASPVVGNQGALVDRVIIDAAVPEPATMLGLAVGLAVVIKRRKK